MQTVAASEPLIWDASAETMPREQLAELQLGRLRETVARVLRGQPLGAGRLTEAGVAGPGDIDTLDDLPGLPFAHKTDLRENYPFGLLAVPREELVRVQASSGSHGKPTVVGYTRADLENWTELMARSMTMAGVGPGMLIHNANGYGLFTGGLGFHQGGERIGATVVPVSGGQTGRQAMLIRDFGAHVLVATPSYSLVIAQALQDAGVDSHDNMLELGLFGGEPWTEGLRTKIDTALGIRAINFYGLSEMCGPGVATECLTARDGLHVQEDHFLVEVVDPADGSPLPPGADGELVFTTLTKEALPLIRYRTGDLGAISLEPCSCGRTTARLIRLGGRRDDMMIIRGVNLYPSAVEQILMSADGVGPHWRLILERTGPMDEVTLECEPSTLDGDRGGLAQTLEENLKEGTGVRIVVSVLEPGGVPRSEGKAVRVVDRR
ncbi:MAG: phenylacetate--CoA ligase family protein [Solirubrobacteraceae bacterium]